MDVPTKEQVQNELGGEGWGERMWLSTEDYLHSLISLVNELVRTLVTSSLHARTDESPKFGMRTVSISDQSSDDGRLFRTCSIFSVCLPSPHLVLSSPQLMLEFE